MALFKNIAERINTTPRMVELKLLPSKKRQFLQEMAKEPSTGQPQQSRQENPIIKATARWGIWKPPRKDMKAPVALEKQGFEPKDLSQAFYQISQTLFEEPGALPQPDEQDPLAQTLSRTVQERLRELKNGREWTHWIISGIIAPATMLEIASHLPPDTKLSTVLAIGAALGAATTFLRQWQLKSKAKKVVIKTIQGASEYFAQNIDSVPKAREYLSRMAKVILNWRSREAQDPIIKIAREQAKLKFGEKVGYTTLHAVLNTGTVYVTAWLLKHGILPRQLAYSPALHHLDTLLLTIGAVGIATLTAEKWGNRISSYKKRFGKIFNQQLRIRRRQNRNSRSS